MDGPLNKVIGEWTGKKCRDAIYVDSLNPEIETYRQFGICHDDYLCVRIAGTNGKGSTTRIVAWALEEQGYDVGMMSNTSTTKTLTDTIQYNGKKIPEKDLKDICNKVASVAHNEVEPYGIRTIAALEWFRRYDVDVTVMESGVASLYDATNIVDSDVYAVTNVGKDHMDSLGGDRESIIRDFARAARNADTLVTNSNDRTARKIEDLSTTDVVIAPDRAELIGPMSNLCFDCEINGDRFTTSLKADY
jgi:dihydropteroate synthase